MESYNTWIGMLMKSLGCTIAEALHKTPTSIRKIKRVSSVFEKFSKAYKIALNEASSLNQCKC